jgi:hypothetical protein
MGYVIRDVCDADLEIVYGLNQSEVPHVGSIDFDRMRWFAENANYFRIAAAGRSIRAYLIGLRPGSTYDSPNYRWFCERYADFAYIDRIVVAADARRTGVATQLYADFAAEPPVARLLACEVNVKPSNPSSMAFHRRLGFRRVGSLSSIDGSKKVAMLAKPLD